MNRVKTLLKGFSLIETLIAFMLVSVMGGAVVYLLAQVVSVTKSADLKSQATSYANQGIESVRDFYQANQWLALAGRDTAAGATCYKNKELTQIGTCRATFTDCNVVPITNTTCENLENGTFFRQISILTESSSKVSVTVNVFWSEKGVPKTAKVDAVFYNY